MDMFSALLIKDGIKVRHALPDNDADTVIVQEALIRSKHCETVVHFVNTDVLGTFYFKSMPEDTHQTSLRSMGAPKFV